MTTAHIFTLVVRISGYLTLLFAAFTLVGLIFGPQAFFSRGLLMALVYGLFGFGIMVFAPWVTQVSGASKSE